MVECSNKLILERVSMKYDGTPLYFLPPAPCLLPTFLKNYNQYLFSNNVAN